MLDDNPFSPRVVTCLTHRKERATHLCTQLNCTHSPILCSLCLNDPRQRSIHPHEGSIRPLSEAVDWLTGTIRSQTKSIELIYQRTIGNRECEIIKFNMQKGSLLFEELDSRIDNMKIQLENELDELMKAFQRQIQQQKQQFHKRFEEYKRLFYSNLQILKKDNNELITFQNSLKYYNNSNSFTLKLITESEKKSQEWILNQKKVLQKVGSILENHNFTSNNINFLTRATKSNLFIFPYWKAQKRDVGDVEKDFRSSIKSTSRDWFQIPNLVDLQARGDNLNSNKYISYPIQV